MSFDPAQHHRRSVRLQSYDYAQAGAYFITLCTQGRECSLGEIRADSLRRSASGELVWQQWQNLPSRFKNISLDACVLMPNHLHGILVIQAPEQPTVGAPLAAPNSLVVPGSQGAASSAPTLPGGVGAASSAPAVGEIIRAFKSLSAIAANRQLGRTGQPFWQRNYWEHVVRSETELHALREYIQNNPKQWEMDSLFAGSGHE